MIINIDCLVGLDQLDLESVNLILTDLPYGITLNKWDSVIPLEQLWPKLWRVLKPNGVIALTASQPFTSQLVMSQLERFKHEWIWIKNRGSNFANTVREPMKEHEAVLIFSRGQWTYNKQMQERTGGGLSLVGKRVSVGGGKREGIGSIKHMAIPCLADLRVPSSWQKFNTEVGLHPTQKPVELMKYLIRTYTNENDLVLDCCAGLGTTGVGAIELKRRFLGFELDPKYCESANTRI